MGSGFTSHLKGWLSSLGFILLTLLVIAAGEWLPYMPAFERFQKAHPSLNQVLIAITLAMTILGGLLLVFTQFLVRLPDVQTTETKGRQKGRGWVFSGATLTAGFSDEARFWRVRKAFRDGEWWRSPRWRRMSLMLLGGILLFYGLFGLLFLLFPPGVKFLLLLAVLYATVRSIYAFTADRPNQQDDMGG